MSSRPGQRVILFSCEGNYALPRFPMANQATPSRWTVAEVLTAEGAFAEAVRHPHDVADLDVLRIAVDEMDVVGEVLLAWKAREPRASEEQCDRHPGALAE